MSLLPGPFGLDIRLTIKFLISVSASCIMYM